MEGAAKTINVFTGATKKNEESKISKQVLPG